MPSEGALRGRQQNGPLSRHEPLVDYIRQIKQKCPGSVNAEVSGRSHEFGLRPPLWKLTPTDQRADKSIHRWGIGQLKEIVHISIATRLPLGYNRRVMSPVPSGSTTAPDDFPTVSAGSLPIPPEPTRADGPSANAQVVEELRRQLNSLQEEVRKDKEGVGGWIKKWGGIVGLIAGIVALPKAGIDIYTALVSLPRTTFDHSKPFSLGYDPVAEAMTASYDVALLNDGTADDLVNEISGTLEPPAPISERIAYFDMGAFELSENGVRVIPPFGISKAAPRHLTCIVKAHVDKGTMPKQSGWWKFIMTLGTKKEKRPLKVEYRFYMDESDVAYLMSTATTIDFPMTR